MQSCSLSLLLSGDGLGLCCREMNNELGKYFCFSPFVRMTQSPSGELRTCVYSPPLEGSYQTLEDAFRSSEMEKIRMEMLEGERRPECEWCYRYDESGQYSCRKDINERWEMVEGLSEGDEIRELDFSAGNKCNFACVTCNGDVSSVWQERERKPGDRYTNLEFPKDPNLKQLTLMGGEPTIDPYFNANFFAELLPVEYFQMVTNASRFPAPYWTDYLSQCVNVVVGISCDGLGELGEFCRFGWNQRSWEKNVLKWTGFLGNDHGEDRQNGVWINFVISNYNVKQVPMFREYCKSNGLRLMLTVAEEPKCICPSYLPKEIKESLKGLDPFVDEILNRSEVNYWDEYVRYTNYLNTFSKKVPYESICWI